jgi:hypothetical protein
MATSATAAFGKFLIINVGGVQHKVSLLNN